MRAWAREISSALSCPRKLFHVSTFCVHACCSVLSFATPRTVRFHAKLGALRKFLLSKPPEFFCLGNALLAGWFDVRNSKILNSVFSMGASVASPYRESRSFPRPRTAATSICAIHLLKRRIKMSTFVASFLSKKVSELGR